MRKTAAPSLAWCAKSSSAGLPRHGRITMNYVIGSGPAGVSATHALLARGEPVTMVDAGLTLEPEREAVIGRMRQQTPAEWSADDVARIKEGMDAGASGVVLKRLFGSDFVYRGQA